MENNAFINFKTNDELTPLYIGKLVCRINLLSFLLNQFLASQAGQKEVVELLLEKNADMHLVSKDGWNTLHIGII